MKQIRFTALLLCAALLFSLCGCTKKLEGVEEGYLLSGSVQTRPEWIVKLGAGEKPVSFAEYRHFFLNAKTDLDLGVEGYFDSHPDAEAALKDTTLGYIKECYALYTLAEEHGITLSKEELDAVEKEAAQKRTELGDELYTTMLNDYYLTEDVYLTLLKNNALYDKTYKTMISEGGAISITEEELKNYLNEEFFCFAQIYVDFRSGEGTYSHEQTDVFLSQITDRLANGDDFYAVAFSHSDDQTMMDYKNGYLKIKTALREEAQTTLENLAENEVSEPVLTGEGYYIYKRLPISDAVIEENRDYLLNGYDDSNGNHVNGLYELRFYDLISTAAKDMPVVYADCYETISTKTLH